MMEGAMYRPVLPDDSVTVNLGSDTQIHPEREPFATRARQARRYPHTKGANTNTNTDPSKQCGQKTLDGKKIPVKLSDNKVLIIGLLIIVVIMIIIIVIQVIRHRRACESDPPPAAPG